MDESPPGRCGYTWPEDYEVDYNPNHQSCCFRETLPDTDRCAWHADPDDTDKKTVQTLRDARADPETRGQTSVTIWPHNHSVDELLDSATLRGVELGDDISLSNIALRSVS